MTTQNNYTPEEIRKVIDTAGVARISFNSVNSTIRDMLSIYAEAFLSADDYKSLCAISDARVRYSAGTYFYIFRQNHYETFLKMIAKESSISGVTMVCTTDALVMYSSQSETSYDSCPTFELKDALEFDNIKGTEYGRQFSSDNTHLCKLTTRKQTLGVKPIKITEFFLYIPN